MSASSYVQRLRRAIGHELLLLPTAAALVEDDDDRLLLVRQSDTGQWATVGGSVDPGESPSDAAIREAHEETGLRVAVTALLGVVGGGPEYEITYPNGDRVAVVSAVYRARAVSGVLRPDGDEVLEAEWFTSEARRGLDIHPLSWPC